MATVIPTPSSSTTTPPGDASLTWLQIARRVRKESALSGTDLSPASVAGQSGEMLNIVNWVQSAWLRIQGMRKWDWMWEAAQVTIDAGEYLADGSISADRYVKDATYDADGRQLGYLPWSKFKLAHPASTIAAGQPTVWTVRPDRSLAVNAMPAADLMLDVERYVNPGPIGADNEYPTMPGHLHEAIVWLAVMHYAGFDEAGSLYQHAKANYQRIMGEAAIDDLPEIEAGPPLC